MAAKILERLAIPSIAASAIIGVAFAATDGFEAAYGDTRSSLDMNEASEWAGNEFDRADIDGNGTIDAAEFGALAVVTAELAHLNGFLVVDEKTIALPIEAPTAIKRTQRTRVGALAARDFYLAAGDDDVISKDEFIHQRLQKFVDADRNSNGKLNKIELSLFALSHSRILPAGV